MTLEELKAEAKKLGYNVIKAKKYERLLPCTCGHNKRSHWYKADYVTLECKKCGRKVSEKNDDDVARIWNDIMRENA